MAKNKKKSVFSLIIGGLFFSIPLILGIVLGKHFFDIIKPLAKTISKNFNLQSLFGSASIIVVCIIILFFIFFLGGVLVEKGIFKKWSSDFEKKLFVFFPSLQIIKFRLIGDNEKIINEFWEAIIFKEDSFYKIGFITEKKDHFTTIYIPDAPKLDAGEVRYMSNKDFEYHHISMKQAMSAIYDFGEGMDIENIISTTLKPKAQ